LADAGRDCQFVNRKVMRERQRLRKVRTPPHRRRRQRRTAQSGKTDMAMRADAHGKAWRQDYGAMETNDIS
jgi:hypothetical protein